MIVESLKKYLTSDIRPCEVVRQHQVAEIPPYPYVAYTVTTPVNQKIGTYSVAEDGSFYKDILQTWSFTVQSDDQDEAMTLALRIYDFFSAVGLTTLADNKISVARVTAVNNRDNLITMEYEYRSGLDVTFSLLYVIAPDPEFGSGVIETIKISKEE